MARPQKPFTTPRRSDSKTFQLTLEQGLTMQAEIEVAACRPYTYDPDCPLLTEEQLREFRPVNFATMEEQAQAMREAGIIDPETEQIVEPQPAEAALSQ